MPRSTTFVALGISLLAFGCTVADASADAEPGAADAVSATPDPVPDGLLGTIEATIDGESAEFYVVAGEIRGDPYAAAVWYETGDGRIMLALGGLDTPTPNLDTFQQGQAGTPVSFGDYEGPVLSLVLDLAAEPEPVTLELPAGDNASSLIYMPRATVDDLTAMYMAASGSLELTEVTLSEGILTAAGSFSGTVRSMGSGEEVEITAGAFAVSDVPHLSQVTAGG